MRGGLPPVPTILYCVETSGAPAAGFIVPNIRSLSMTDYHAYFLFLLTTKHVHKTYHPNSTVTFQLAPASAS